MVGSSTLGQNAWHKLTFRRLPLLRSVLAAWSRCASPEGRAGPCCGGCPQTPHLPGPGPSLCAAYAAQLQSRLSTRAGTEALAHVATERHPRATIVSVDAAGVYRGAMLAPLHARPELQPLLPYTRQFYATPSSYTWVDAWGTCHTVTQGEEKGDPLYSLAAHPALHALHAGAAATFAPTSLLAFLDHHDAPPRQDVVGHYLWHRAKHE